MSGAKTVPAVLLGIGAIAIAAAPRLLTVPIEPLLQWWCLMAAAAVAIVAVCYGTAWRMAGLLAALLLCGVSAQFTLNEPIWFQEIRLNRASPSTRLFLGVLFLQAAGTSWLLYTGRGLFPLLSFLRIWGYPRILLLGVLLLAVSVGMTKYVAQGNILGFLKQLVLVGAFSVLNLLNLAAILVHVPGGPLAALADRITRRVSLLLPDEESRPLDGRLPFLVAAWVLAASALFSLFALQRMPHVPDEVVYLFQAKYFLQGRLFVDAPPALDALGYDFIASVGGKWFSIFPPGWPLVLAAGVSVNLPWLVNPMLAAAGVLLTHAYFRRVAGVGVANVAILVMAASPWFIETSSSLMSHTLTLVLLLVAWVLLLRGWESLRASAALFAGGLMGFMFLTRPVDGLVAGTLTGIWCLIRMRAAGQGGWRIVLLYGLGCIAVGGLAFPYNRALTGDPLVTPLERYFDAEWGAGKNRIGFGEDIGPQNRWEGIDLYPGHSVTEALINSQQEAFALNTEFLGTIVGSLVFLFVLLLWGRWRTHDVAMGVFGLAIVGALSLYWFSGAYYIGPRYWFLIFVPLVGLTVSGIATVHRRVAPSGNAAAGARLGLALGLIGVLAVTSFLSWRGVTKFHEYRGFHTGYRELLARHDLRRALIFVKAGSESEYASAFVHVEPGFVGVAPVFARDLGAESNRRVAAAFPGRPVYFVAGRSRPGEPVRLVKGPVLPGPP